MANYFPTDGSLKKPHLSNVFDIFFNWTFGLPDENITDDDWEDTGIKYWFKWNEILSNEKKILKTTN